MREEDEARLYYELCKLSRICKKYFYNRKYIPSAKMEIHKVLKEIFDTTNSLRKKYDEIKNNKKS